MARVNKSERERSPRTPDRDLAFARRMVIDITTPAYMIYKEVFKSLGSNVCCGVHACELKKDPIIKAMMEETRKTVREEFMVTVESLIAELEEERLSLVQGLEAEGFALINAKREPAEDMTDWRNWKAGDLIECVNEGDGPYSLTVGCVYKLKDYRRLVTLIDDDGDHVRRCIREGCFKFVSRP